MIRPPEWLRCPPGAARRLRIRRRPARLPGTPALGAEEQRRNDRQSRPQSAAHRTAGNAPGSSHGPLPFVARLAGAPPASNPAAGRGRHPPLASCGATVGGSASRGNGSANPPPAAAATGAATAAPRLRKLWTGHRQRQPSPASTVSNPVRNAGRRSRRHPRSPKTSSTKGPRRPPEKSTQSAEHVDRKSSRKRSTACLGDVGRSNRTGPLTVTMPVPCPERRTGRCGRRPDRGLAGLPGRQPRNERGHLEVAGCDVVELAAELGTPAYIYAETTCVPAPRLPRGFRAPRPTTSRSSSRARRFACTAAYRLFAEEGLSVDVASGGELHVALAAGFEPERIYMHGNNKTEAELLAALDAGVGHLVLDSFDEIDRCDGSLEPQDVLIRVTPGIKPDDPRLHPDRAARLQVRLRPRGRAAGAGGGARAGCRASIWSAGCTPISAPRSSSSSPTAAGDPGVRPAGRREEPPDQRRRRSGDRLHRARMSPPIETYVEVKVRAVAEVFDDGCRILASRVARWSATRV